MERAGVLMRVLGADIGQAHDPTALAVSITGGKLVRRSGDVASAPKETLLGLLVAAVEQRQLKVARGCPAAAELLAELAAYWKRRDAGGRIRIEARGPEHHGDLAIATALGLFAQGLARADRR